MYTFSTLKKGKKPSTCQSSIIYVLIQQIFPAPVSSAKYKSRAVQSKINQNKHIWGVFFMTKTVHRTGWSSGTFLKECKEVP